MWLSTQHGKQLDRRLKFVKVHNLINLRLPKLTKGRILTLKNIGYLLLKQYYIHFLESNLKTKTPFRSF